MAAKNLHIVPSDQTAKRVFRIVNCPDSDEIAVCPVVFSCGILPKTYDKKELEDTAEFLRLYSYYSLYDFVHKEYSAYDKVIVWHGRTAEELLLLYMMADLTKDNLYEIDLADCEEFFVYFQKHSLYHYPVITTHFLEPEDMDKYDWLNDYLKKVNVEQHEKYKREWKYWRKSPSLLRVCKKNNFKIESIDPEYIEGLMHKIINQKWFYWLCDPIKYAALIDNIVPELYSFQDRVDWCYNIADYVLRNCETVKENCHVDMYDIIQWKEAYMLTKLMEQSKLREIRPSIRKEVNSMTYEY